MEFIGGLGGVGKLLLKLSGWIIGGYASFHSALMTISALYKVKKYGRCHLPRLDNSGQFLHEFDIPLSTRIQLYFLDTPLKHLLVCFKTERNSFFQDIIAKGKINTKNDFDIKQMIL